MMSRTYLITIQHPAHVHFFKHTIAELTTAGHEVFVYAREKDVTVALLEHYGIPHRVLAGTANSFRRLAAVQATYEYRLLREARRVRPDVLAAIGGIAVSHVATLVGARSVVFTDTESGMNRFVVPFADVVCTPQHFPVDFGVKQVRYDGYHELAYLHPDRFEPDPERLRAYGIDPDEHFSVCRFSDMRAHHDVGETGLSNAAKRKLVSLLSEHGPVFAAAEGTPVPARTRPVPPHLAHQLLSHAAVFVTDSSTMAAEAGMLGTPTVRSNSFAGEGELSNFVQLEHAGLVFSTPDEQEALSLTRTFLHDSSHTSEWRRRRERFLAETVDVTAFVVTLLTAVADPKTPVSEAIRSDAVRSAATNHTAQSNSSEVNSYA